MPITSTDCHVNAYRTEKYKTEFTSVRQIEKNGYAFINSHRQSTNIMFGSINDFYSLCH